MRVSQILTRNRSDIVYVDPLATMRTAIRLMHRHRIGCVLVLQEDDLLVAVLSERDVVHAFAADTDELLDRPVIDFAHRDSPTAAPDDTVQAVMAVMTATRARHIPIIQFGRVVGIVSIGDIVKSCLNEMIQENAVLQQIARAQYFAN
ncbi:MAG TPA: CBS domain-containing protein [Rhodanobacter sp.]